ncbi:MAG: hypothetical protein INF43_05120 [Alphaproteobacteria bacterium]|nr:hypothetical protein [Alphaproteobacteria bacterium]
MPRHKRNPNCTHAYHVDVIDWEANTSFNDHAYMNMFGEGPFQENPVITLIGTIDLEQGKTKKKGLPVKVIIWCGEYWHDPRDRPKDEEPIGNVEILRSQQGNKSRDTLFLRISLPPRSWELVLATLVANKKLKVFAMGSPLEKKSGKIYQVSIRSSTASGE